MRAQMPKRGRGRPRRLGPDSIPTQPAVQDEVASSLPPTQPEPLLESSPSTEGAQDERHIAMVREPSTKERMGMTIVAMRIAGMTDDEIAEKLGYKKVTLAGYVYHAAKNGWLDLPTVREAMQYNLLPKVVKRLYEGLHDENRLQSGMPIKTQIALKIAEGTIFKEFDKTETGNATVVALRIEMPQGAVPAMRDDTMGGTPAYVDAEVVHGDGDH